MTNDKSARLKIPLPGERQAEAIRAAKDEAYKLIALNDHLRIGLEKIREHLRVLEPTDRSEELQQLIRLHERIRNLLNAMEIGSFKIACDRTLEECWRRLP